MSFEISDEIMQTTGMSKTEMALEVAVMLFEKNKLTLAQAAHLAELSQFQFQNLLASRRIPVHYDLTDLAEDVETLRRLNQL